MTARPFFGLTRPINFCINSWYFFTKRQLTPALRKYNPLLTLVFDKNTLYVGELVKDPANRLLLQHFFVVTSTFENALRESKIAAYQALATIPESYIVRITLQMNALFCKKDVEAFVAMELAKRHDMLHQIVLHSPFALSRLKSTKEGAWCYHIIHYEKGDTDEMDVHIIATPQVVVQYYLRLFAALQIKGLVIEPELAAYERAAKYLPSVMPHTFVTQAINDKHLSLHDRLLESDVILHGKIVMVACGLALRV